MKKKEILKAIKELDKNILATLLLTVEPHFIPTYFNFTTGDVHQMWLGDYLYDLVSKDKITANNFLALFQIIDSQGHNWLHYLALQPGYFNSNILVLFRKLLVNKKLDALTIVKLLFERIDPRGFNFATTLAAYHSSVIDRLFLLLSDIIFLTKDSDIIFTELSRPMIGDTTFCHLLAQAYQGKKFQELIIFFQAAFSITATQALSLLNNKDHEQRNVVDVLSLHAQTSMSVNRTFIYISQVFKAQDALLPRIVELLSNQWQSETTLYQVIKKQKQGVFLSNIVDHAGTLSSESFLSLLQIFTTAGPLQDSPFSLLVAQNPIFFEFMMNSLVKHILGYHYQPLADHVLELLFNFHRQGCNALGYYIKSSTGRASRGGIAHDVLKAGGSNIATFINVLKLFRYFFIREPRKASFLAMKFSDVYVHQKSFLDQLAEYQSARVNKMFLGFFFECLDSLQWNETESKGFGKYKTKADIIRELLVMDEVSTSYLHNLFSNQSPEIILMVLDKIKTTINHDPLLRQFAWGELFHLLTNNSFSQEESAKLNAYIQELLEMLLFESNIPDTELKYLQEHLALFEKVSHKILGACHYVLSKFGDDKNQNSIHLICACDHFYDLAMIDRGLEEQNQLLRRETILRKFFESFVNSDKFISYLEGRARFIPADIQRLLLNKALGYFPKGQNCLNYAIGKLQYYNYQEQPPENLMQKPDYANLQMAHQAFTGIVLSSATLTSKQHIELSLIFYRQYFGIRPKKNRNLADLLYSQRHLQLACLQGYQATIITQGMLTEIWTISPLCKSLFMFNEIIDKLKNADLIATAVKLTDYINKTVEKNFQEPELARLNLLCERLTNWMQMNDSAEVEKDCNNYLLSMPPLSKGISQFFSQGDQCQTLVKEFATTVKHFIKSSSQLKIEIKL